MRLTSFGFFTLIGVLLLILLIIAAPYVAVLRIVLGIIFAVSVILITGFSFFIFGLFFGIFEGE